jgi:hypothetical protein
MARAALMIPAIISAVPGGTALLSLALPEEVPGKGLR